MYQIEFFHHFLAKQMDQPDVGFFNPYGQPTILDPKVTPTHYTTEGGGHYSARPDLSRSGGPGVYRAAAAAALIGATIVGATAITESYGFVIRNEEPQEHRSLWRSYSSALTGTFGIGSGLNL